MTDRPHPTTVGDVFELVSDRGFDGMAEAMHLFLNKCMKLDRQALL